jgi:hypothetical protein
VRDITFDLGQQAVAEQLVRRHTHQDEEHADQEGERHCQPGPQRPWQQHVQAAHGWLRST